jgi:hypothetical protein
MDKSQQYSPIKEKKGLSVWKAALSLLLLMVAGIWVSLLKAPFAFGSGDHMLFHSFGHWIANGEVFTKDFVHFRTPGPYYYYGLMQILLGQTFHTTSLSLLLEAHLFQVIASFTLTLALTRVIGGKASIWIASMVGLFFVIAPPIYQLRTAIPALSLALYITSLLHDNVKNKANGALIASGILLGFSFWFGQELFLFLSFAIFIAEISFKNPLLIKKKISRLVIIAISTLIPIAIGLAYLYINGVNLQQFLYNTLYYAFFIQPKGMDVPFPALNMASIIYYVWIAVYCIAMFIFTARRVIYSPASIVLFSYAAMRMISMFGRVDVLHLMFSISELVVLIALSTMILFDCSLKTRAIDLFKGLVSVTACAIVFYIAIEGKSSIFLIIPLLLLLLSYVESKSRGQQVKVEGNAGKFVFFISGASALIFSLVLIYPLSLNAIKFTYYLNFVTPHPNAMGVTLPAAEAEEFENVKKIIANYKADSIFSYPIRADFYALAPKHGTRFIEFAPQTTQNDVSQAIADLGINKPDLVFQDLDQDAYLSPILNRLSNYIYSNYEPVEIIQGYSKLQVFKRREQPTQAMRLYDNVYTFNPDHTHVTGGLRTLTSGKDTPVVAINQGWGTFKFPKAEGYVALTVYPEPGASQTGSVMLIKNGQTESQTISLTDGTVYVQIPPGTGELEIKLKSAEEGKSVLWQNPQVVLNK